MALADVIGDSWMPYLEAEFKKEYMQKLSAWISHYRQSITIYPDGPDVFKALKLCPFDKVKVVIIGKEPYPNGEADGLAFSYKNGQALGSGKQSLDVIFDEIETDCYNGLAINRNYQLDYLAEQGVLLLNSVLTVQRKKVDSHKEIGWQTLTSKILSTLLEEQSPKVIMLWGNDAQNVFHNAAKSQYTPYWDHCVLKAYHPAYDLHKRDSFGRVVVRYPDGFTGCKHFSQANHFLLSRQRGAIDWIEVEKNIEIEPLSNQSPF